MKIVAHNIPPVYDGNSEILILGSFPSVKSRQSQFFYGHPQNRFWRVLAAVFAWGEVPKTNDEKRGKLLESRVALWDVIGSCEITGSSDASIKNVVPNDVGIILDAAKIRAIYCNGNKAFWLYEKYIYPVIKIPAVRLPSTSPANAGKPLDALIDEWKIINI